MKNQKPNFFRRIKQKFCRHRWAAKINCEALHPVFGVMFLCTETRCVKCAKFTRVYIIDLESELLWKEKGGA